MAIHFTKYHGTGNDFIMIDDRSERFDISNVELISNMCSRRFGIGADGLILLRLHKDYDFEMVYFNADGRQSSMCGNGGRCLVKFAHSFGLFESTCTFLAIDGEHDGEVLVDGSIKLKMSDVDNISKADDDYVLDTGSPHYVKLVDDPMNIDVKTAGQSIRYSDTYKEEGINVNFINYKNDILHVATYERGVEDETYSCGTGVTACALVADELIGSHVESPVDIRTKGGDLKVYFESLKSGFRNIWLEGPAKKVFTGEW